MYIVLKYFKLWVEQKNWQVIQLCLTTIIEIRLSLCEDWILEAHTFKFLKQDSSLRTTLCTSLQEFFPRDRFGKLDFKKREMIIEYNFTMKNHVDTGINHCKRFYKQ